MAGPAIVRLSLAGVGLYAALLLGVSLTSRERLLDPGQEKFFCGLDCDLALSVAGVRTASVLGEKGEVRPTGRRFLIVGIRIRSDAARVAMTPQSLRVRLKTSDGRFHDPSPRGQAALIKTGRSTSLRPTLGPGQAAVAEVAFDVDATEDARLLVTEGGWPTRLMIGDENSLFHRKTFFIIASPRAGRPGSIPTR